MSSDTKLGLILLINVTVIILGMLVPNLLRSRGGGNEASAIGGSKTIAAAQTDYINNSNPPTYASELWDLHTGRGAGNVSFMDAALGEGDKSGYTFTLVAGCPDRNGSLYCWSAAGWPQEYGTTGVRSFYVDESGITRGADVGGYPGIIEMPDLETLWDSKGSLIDNLTGSDDAEHERLRKLAHERHFELLEPTPTPIVGE